MNLDLYMRILWRFRVLVAGGLLLTAGLAFLSYARIGSDGFSYRESEQWASYATMLVGGPEFSISSSAAATDDPRALAERLGIQQVALQRYTSLAILFARLADSDEVLSIVRRNGPIRGRIEAAALPASDNNSDALPLLRIAALSNSAEQATWLAEQEVDALQKYLVQQQVEEAVPADRRVTFTVVKEPTPAILFSGRSTTLPIVVFLSGLIGIIALVSVLENFRPRGPVRRDDPQALDTRPELGRRSA